MSSSEANPFPWVQGAGFGYRVAKTGGDRCIGSEEATRILRNSFLIHFWIFITVLVGPRGPASQSVKFLLPPLVPIPIPLLFVFLFVFVLCVRQPSRSGVQCPRPGSAWPNISSILPRSPNFNFVSLCLNPAPTVCSACTVSSINAMSACRHGKPHVSVRVPTSLASPCSR